MQRNTHAWFPQMLLPTRVHAGHFLLERGICALLSAKAQVVQELLMHSPNF
jgi:hypothetical protein